MREFDFSKTSEDIFDSRLRRFVEEKQSNVFLSNWNASVPATEPEICFIKPFVIDFADLGFSSWILEPKNFLANLCSGACQAKVRWPLLIIEHFFLLF